MMCQRMGRPPSSTIGFGRMTVSSLRRVPSPPARMTVFRRRMITDDCRALTRDDAVEPFLAKLRDRPGGLGARCVRADADEDQLIALHALGARSALRGAIDQF